MADRRPIRWGNVVVPYTVMWSAEAERRAPTTQWEKWAGRRLRMLCEGINEPAGKPLFKMLHADRCREVIREKLCQMCLQPLPRRVVTVNQGQQDGYRPLISDGLPMCGGCAAEALRSCPGLQRQAQDGTVRFWALGRGLWDVAPVILGRRSVSEGGDERVNAALAKVWPMRVFTGPKLVLCSWERVDPTEQALEAVQ